MQGNDERELKSRLCLEPVNRDPTPPFPLPPLHPPYPHRHSRHRQYRTHTYIAMASMFEQPRNGTLFLGGTKISGTEIRDQNG